MLYCGQQFLQMWESFYNIAYVHDFLIKMIYNSEHKWKSVKQRVYMLLLTVAARIFGIILLCNWSNYSQIKQHGGHALKEVEYINIKN